MVEMELSELRAPGAAVQLHEKLSSPSRKRSLKDSIQKQEERQTRAEEIRLKLQEEKAARLRELSRKVDEVKAAREGVMEKKRELLDTRMSKAEENRTQQIKAIVQKAHDEDEKVQEIAFINSLEAGNKRHEVWVRHHDSEQRLHIIQEERQRKLEEKAARETAAEERRKHLEQERLNRLAEMAERRNRREQQIQEQKKELEKERLLQAKEKAREREERMAEMKAMNKAHTEDLIQKIQHKQEKTNKRYEENLEQIKLRASEMSTPRSNSTVSEELLKTPPSARPFPRSKYCTVCAALIPNEVHLESHLRGKKHMDAVKENKPLKTSDVEPVKEDGGDKSIIVDAPEDKLVPSKADKKEKNGKFSKKKRQALRKKMQQKAHEYSSAGHQAMQFATESPNKIKFQKSIKDMTKLLEANGLDKIWLETDFHSLERVTSEINRILSRRNSDDAECFLALNGCMAPLKFFPLLEKPEASVVPVRTLLNVVSILKNTGEASLKVCLDYLYSNRLTTIVDVICSLMATLPADRLFNENSNKWGPIVFVYSFLLDMISAILNEMSRGFIEAPESTTQLIKTLPQGVSGFSSRMSVFSTYLVYGNVIESVARRVAAINEPPLDERYVDLMCKSVDFISDVQNLLALSVHSPFDLHLAGGGENSQFVESLKSSSLCGVVSLLYSLMLSPAECHSTGDSDRRTPPPLSDVILRVVRSSVELINSTAAVSVSAVQEVLSQEGISLEFRHICSYLLSYCSHANSTDLLHDVILMIGYFTVLNPENQNLVLVGSHPSILQQLCLLPFAYFSDPKLSRVLFPTLVSCVFENSLNRQTLELEMSGILLAEFINEQVDRRHKTMENSSEEQLATSDKFEFVRRFPVAKWELARDFFMSPCVEENST